MTSRLYYREKDGHIVLEQNGLDVMSYKSVNDLVESHIKGLLAIEKQAGNKHTELRGLYHSVSSSGSF